MRIELKNMMHYVLVWNLPQKHLYLPPLTIIDAINFAAGAWDRVKTKSNTIVMAEEWNFATDGAADYQ